MDDRDIMAGVLAEFRLQSVRIEVSAGRDTAVLTDVSCCFPQSLQATVSMVFRLGNDRFLPNTYQLIIRLWSHCIPSAS
jgi:hypothetical protein